MNIILFLLIQGFIISAFGQWPADSEPFGLFGCKFFRYKGFWEEVIDTVYPENAISGACLSVAMANIINYHRWPHRSHFDGVFISSRYDELLCSIQYTWKFGLINGNKGRLEDCGDDDPEKRVDSKDKSWNGKKEIQKLLFVVERAFGNNPELFKTDSKDCGGAGYFPIEHVMRNRFGYAACRILSLNKIETKQYIIRNIKNKLPVIAMKCDHAFIIDGYKKDINTGSDLFHSCDYIMGDESIGWFSWKYYHKEGVRYFIVDLIPEYVILPAAPKKVITYMWGNEFIPGTGDSFRRGYIIIQSANTSVLGNLFVRLDEKDPAILHEKKIKHIYNSMKYISSKSIRIPTNGTFSFQIADKASLQLSLHSKDDGSKRLLITFHDFENNLP